MKAHQQFIDVPVTNLADMIELSAVPKDEGFE
jgi:hypothetical protein